MYALTSTANCGLVAHALDRGTRIADRFVVENKIADGTVASVYRAHDEQAGIDVALKVFDPLRGADAVARRRFEREFDILAQLRDPGVARARDFLPGDDFDVLVLELVEGESLRDRLGRGPFDVEEAVRLATSLAKTLDVCHRAGVIHRDLKPANIIVHPERGPVILDFGVAWFSSAMTLTRTGAIVGSPKYLAPETFESSDIDERVDVYAVGAILFECLTGRPARDGETVVEMLSASDALEPPSVREHAPNVSASIDRIVKRALSPQPEGRFATAAELMRALEGAAVDVGRPLASNLPCPECATPLVIDLPICPGCGRSTEWALARGDYAVQILEVEDVERTARWLTHRYPIALRLDPRWLEKRLATAPAPLVKGVSSETAEALASAARASGCRVEILRSRTLVGPALRMPSVSAGQIVRMMGAHFFAVMVLGSAAILAGASHDVVSALPFVVGAAGLLSAFWWTRVPLLSVDRYDERFQVHPALRDIADRITRFESPRARRLVAGALARAAPILVGDDAGISEEAKIDALGALDRAVDAAQSLDTHAKVLAARPRARLRRAADRLDPEVDGERFRELEDAQREIGEIAVAHDLAARRALEATEAISTAMTTRSM